MAEHYEPYVADPAEPPVRPRLAAWRVHLWTAIVILLFASLVWMYFEGRGEDDPALRFPPSGQDS